MTKCIKCKQSVESEFAVCAACLPEWAIMRGKAYGVCERKFGMLNLDNLKLYQDEVHLLEKVWSESTELFNAEISIR